MVLKVDEVSKSYVSAEGRVSVLAGVSLTLGAGESLALTGESGSGKSTLLHLIAGLDTPDSGDVEIGGTRLFGGKIAGRQGAALDDAGRAMLRRNRIGLVFQQFNLIPSLTAGANLAFQARLAGRHDPDWTAYLAQTMGLAALLHRYPEELSGGQQQRVAIGRALALRPDLILADEPTGNLDEATGDTVLALMLGLVAEARAALLMVTHSGRLADRLDRRLHLTSGRVTP